jgi:DNA-binding LytR/AlgR family response regulator
MRYLIIEDELPAQRLMEGLVRELRPGWESAGCVDSVEGAVEWFGKQGWADVIFMDIQLSDGLSFDILEQVEIEGMIIFTTAYDEYAIRAFKVNSIDYLLKPIKKKDLREALEKYERYTRKMFLGRNKAIDVAELVEAVNGAKKNFRTRFLVSRGEMFVPLPVESVAFLFSRNRITSAVTFDGKRYVLDFTLDGLEDQLDPERFFRASRQFMVNIEAVSKVHTFFNGKLILETLPAHDEKITVSREKARVFKPWLDR